MMQISYQEGRGCSHLLHKDGGHLSIHCMQSKRKTESGHRLFGAYKALVKAVLIILLCPQSSSRSCFDNGSVARDAQTHQFPVLTNHIHLTRRTHDPRLCLRRSLWAKG